ncbi:hypothetical protein [Nostoc sp.]|uniref:hypothetical protein n=1 Tax=Nostoc sp. TaxID=1180 RepID=UPI002FF50919
MKFSTLIDSILVVASIALLPGIGGAQTATNNSGEPIAINSNNLPTHSTNVSYLKLQETPDQNSQAFFQRAGVKVWQHWKKGSFPEKTSWAS